MKFIKQEHWLLLLSGKNVKIGFILPHVWAKTINRSSLVCAISWILSFRTHYLENGISTQLCVMGFNYAKIKRKTN